MKHLATGMLFALALCICCTASAATWNVLPDSTGDAPTIQAGIDSASAGETVLVASGTYYEYGINLKSGIVLRSEYNDPYYVTIDGGSLGTVLVGSSVDSTTTAEGFTITGAAGVWGGGADLVYSLVQSMG